MATALNRASVRTTRKGRNPLNMVRGIYTLWYKHMLKFVSTGGELLGTLFFPVLWMILFGVCMDTILKGVTNSTTGVGYTAYITPGVMLLTSLTAAVLSGSTLLNERLHGLIKEYLVAPIPRLAILLGTLSSGLTKAVLQALVVLGLGLLLDSSLLFNPPALVAALGLIAAYSLGFVGIAAAFASKAKDMEGYHSIILIINLPVLFVSNALYPLSKMPETLRTLAYLNPTTYAVDATRHLFYGVPLEIGLWIDGPVLLAFMVAGIWYAYFTFKQAALDPAY